MAGQKNQLTTRALQSLKIGAWANDSRPHGAGQLQARKLASGAIGFYYRYTGPGREQIRLPLGSELTLLEARIKAAELSKRYQSGDRDLRASAGTEVPGVRHRLSSSSPVEGSSIHTLGALLTAYVQSLRDSGKVSAQDTEGTIRLHVREPWPELWDKPAKDVTMDDLLLVVARAAQAGKLRLAGKIRSFLQAAYASAIRARQDARSSHALRALCISHNPARDLATIEGSSEARERALSVAELRAYWRRIEVIDSANGAMLQFHLLTGGQRIAQLARATADCIDKDMQAIRLLDGKGRRKKPRQHYIPLLPAAEAALKMMRGGEYGPYIFTVSEGLAPAKYDVVRCRMDSVVEAMEAAGELEGSRFTPGDLRRTIETRLAAAGQSLEVRAQLQSHGLGGVQSRHYDRHDYLGEKRAALESLWQILTGEPATVTSINRQRLTP